MVESSDEEIQSLFAFKEFFTPLQNEIMEALEDGPKTRKELVKVLDRARTTVYDNLVKLQKKELVEKYTYNNEKRGRPKVYWRSCSKDGKEVED